MILVPRDNEGGKQSLATLDIMAPGTGIFDAYKYYYLSTQNKATLMIKSDVSDTQ